MRAVCRVGVILVAAACGAGPNASRPPSPPVSLGTAAPSAAVRWLADGRLAGY